MERIRGMADPGPGAGGGSGKGNGRNPGAVQSDREQKAGAWGVKTGTCPWCDGRDQVLRWFVWFIDEQVIRDWACDRCQRANRAPTANENED